MANIGYFHEAAQSYDSKFGPGTECQKGFLWAQNKGHISRVAEGITKKPS